MKKEISEFILDKAVPDSFGNACQLKSSISYTTQQKKKRKDSYIILSYCCYRYYLSLTIETTHHHSKTESDIYEISFLWVESNLIDSNNNVFKLIEFVYCKFNMGCMKHYSSLRGKKKKDYKGRFFPWWSTRNITQGALPTHAPNF